MAQCLRFMENSMPVYTDLDIAAFNDVLRRTGAGSAAMKLALFQQNPISPPNEATGNLLDGARGNILSTRRNDVVEFTKLKIDDGGERISYITLAAATGAKQGALTFDCTTADSTPIAARATQAPIWWLPWKSRHMVKMKIAPAGTAVWDSQNIPIPNPDLFFTAAVSGCSVFVRGLPTAPSIYHGGIDGKLVDAMGESSFLVRGVFNKSQFKKLGGTTPEFWRQVLSGMDYDTTDGHTTDMKATRGADKFNRPNQPISEVNTTHYTSDKGTKTTVNSRALERFLTKQATARGRQIDVVAPWGSVFALRTGGNWAFYLQQNVLLVYTKLTSGQQISDCVVLACTPFYPGAGEADPPKLKSRDFERIEAALA